MDLTDRRVEQEQDRWLQGQESECVGAATNEMKVGLTNSDRRVVMKGGGCEKRRAKAPRWEERVE